MFMGFPLESWIELELYGLFILALFIGVGVLSYKLSYICFPVHKQSNKRVKKDVRKKKIFFDVA